MVDTITTHQVSDQVILVKPALSKHDLLAKTLPRAPTPLLARVALPSRSRLLERLHIDMMLTHAAVRLHDATPVRAIEDVFRIPLAVRTTGDDRDPGHVLVELTDSLKVRRTDLEVELDVEGTYICTVWESGIRLEFCKRTRDLQRNSSCSTPRWSCGRS